VDSNSLLVFILLPLLVLATVITFLLVQRARKKRDAGQ
jgi:preprotein translocase subunit YajC